MLYFHSNNRCIASLQLNRPHIFLVNWNTIDTFIPMYQLFTVLSLMNISDTIIDSEWNDYTLDTFIQYMINTWSPTFTI